MQYAYNLVGGPKWFQKKTVNLFNLEYKLLLTYLFFANRKMPGQQYTRNNAKQCTYEQ